MFVAFNGQELLQAVSEERNVPLPRAVPLTRSPQSVVDARGYHIAWYWVVLAQGVDVHKLAGKRLELNVAFLNHQTDCGDGEFCKGRIVYGSSLVPFGHLRHAPLWLQ